MNLPTFGNILLLSGGNTFKSKKFNHNKFDPDVMFKPVEQLKLSYSALNEYKECKIKFAMKKFLDLGFFKTNEALFLGSLVHKFVENMINSYTSGTLSFDTYNSVAKENFDGIQDKFNRSNYATEDKFVENIFKYAMDRKTFSPDLFFDDISYIVSVCSQQGNYIEGKKVLFQNAARLLKQLFAVTSKVNATKFNCESWIKFPIDDLPVTFIGKIDLYFPYEYNGQRRLCIIDFKTGQRKYFNWDQLNYYGIYFGEAQFPYIDRYFFDIKECERIRNEDTVNYKEVYDKLKGMCSDAVSLIGQFEDVRSDLKDQYAEKLGGILQSADKDQIHKVPCEIMMAVFDLLDKGFFKAKKIPDYHSNGGYICSYCDVLNFCSVRA